jgi:hypothetical protein
VNKAALFVGLPRVDVDRALVVYTSGDMALVKRVIANRETLHAAASRVKGAARLAKAYVRASSEDKIAFTKMVGPTALWTATIEPALETGKVASPTNGAAPHPIAASH